MQINSLVAKVFENKQFSQFKNLNETELIEQRKKNPALDIALYDAQKAQMLEDVAKEKMIALKVAKGEKLSKEEQEFMEKNNPQLLQKAAMAKEFVKQLKQNKNTNSLHVLSAINNIQKYDPQYAELVSQSFNSSL